MAKRNQLHTTLRLFTLMLLCGCANWPQTVQQAYTTDPSATSALKAYLAERAAMGSEVSDDRYRPWVVLLPFEDDSGFRAGVFDLPVEIPRMLADMLAQKNACRIVPSAAVEELVGGRGARWAREHLEMLGDSLQADHIITGMLLDYNFERLQVGDPLLGGYKSYVGIAEIEAELRAGGQSGLIGTAHSKRETQNRGIGLDLLGKPREGDRQFVELGQMQFGGEEFRGTAIGEATVLAMEVIVARIVELLRPQELVGLSEVPTVLSIFGEEIFINVGNDNGVKKGYRFRIETTPGVEPAIVEVEDVISASVSRVKALRGGEHIAAGQTLTLVGVQGDGGE